MEHDDEEVFHNCVDWVAIIEKKDEENLKRLRKKDEEIKEARDRCEYVLKELRVAKKWQRGAARNKQDKYRERMKGRR